MFRDVFLKHARIDRKKAAGTGSYHSASQEYFAGVRAQHRSRLHDGLSPPVPDLTLPRYRREKFEVGAVTTKCSRGVLDRADLDARELAPAVK